LRLASSIGVSGIERREAALGIQNRIREFDGVYACVEANSMLRGLGAIYEAKEI
jgi:hypothetical protein